MNSSFLKLAVVTLFLAAMLFATDFQQLRVLSFSGGKQAFFFRPIPTALNEIPATTKLDAKQQCRQAALNGSHYLLQLLSDYAANQWEFPAGLSKASEKQKKPIGFYSDLIRERGHKSQFDYLTELVFESWGQVRSYMKNRPAKYANRPAVVIKVAHSIDLCCVLSKDDGHYEQVDFDFVLVAPFGDVDNWSPLSWSNPWDVKNGYNGLRHYLKNCKCQKLIQSFSIKDLCGFLDNRHLVLWLTIQQGFMHPKVQSIPVGLKQRMYGSNAALQARYLFLNTRYHSFEFIRSSKPHNLTLRLFRRQSYERFVGKKFLTHPVSADAYIRYNAAEITWFAYSNMNGYENFFRYLPGLERYPYLKRHLIAKTFSGDAPPVGGKVRLKVAYPYPEQWSGKTDRAAFEHVMTSAFFNSSYDSVAYVNLDACEDAALEKICKLHSITDYVWKVGQAFLVPSPFGYGMDCHRHYEVMLFGSVPIIRQSSMDDIYSQLPVLLVGSATDLMQLASWEQLLDRYADVVCDESKRRWELLTWSYWENLINHTSYFPDEFRRSTRDYMASRNSSKVLCYS